MKRFSACAAMMLAVGLLSAEEPKEEWVKIAAEKEKYEAQFPANPRKMTQYVLECENGKVAILLQSNKLPKEVDLDEAESVKLILDAGRDALARFHKGSKILSEKESKFDKKYPARDIDLDVPAIGLYRTRFILTPTNFYQIAVGGPKDYVDGAEATKFFDSFKLMD